MTSINKIRALARITESSINKFNPQLRDDLVQEGIESALNALKTFRKGKGKVSLRNWLIRHMRRDMIRYLSRDNRHQGHANIEDILADENSTEFTDLSAAERLENELDLYQMVQCLPDPERTIVWAHAYSDMSFADIARLLRMPKQSVYRNYINGVTKIQQKFMVQKPDDPA